MLQNLIIGISGIKGYGKSTYLRELVQDEESLLIVDTLGEHSDWCPLAPGDSRREQIETIAEPPERFRWSLMLSGEDTEEHLDYVCRAVYRAGDMTFVLEEADYFSSANSDIPGVKSLVRYGRHRAINLIWVTRNLAEVSRRLTSQTDIFVFFRTDEPLYVEKLAKRLTPDLAAEIQRLSHFDYIIFDKNTGNILRGRTKGS